MNGGVRRARAKVGDAVAAQASPKAGRSSRKEALEREADGMAARVLSGVRPPLLQPVVSPGTAAGLAQSAPEAAATRAVTGQAGAPLPRATRDHFEPRFGRDFSQVRVHAHVPAAEAMGARAFAFGRNIGFAPGEYAPATQDGRALIAHELAHVVQQEAGGRAHVQRKDKRQQPAAEQSVTIVAITAQQHALAGEATLEDGGTVPIRLSRNGLRPGSHVVKPASRTVDRSAPDKAGSGEPGEPGAFYWFAGQPGPQANTRLISAPQVIVTITQSAEQRIGALPPHIRRLLTTDAVGVPLATPGEIEAVAEAGELLERGGFSDEEALLLEEKLRRDRELGVTPREAPDSVTWALTVLAQRAQSKRAAETGFGDLVTLAKALASQPLYLGGKGLLGTLLDPGSDEMEEANIRNMLRFEISEKRLEPSQIRDKALGLALLRTFREQLRGFEKALLAHLGRLGRIELAKVDAALLRMDRAFTGIWQPSSPSPTYFWRHLERARSTPAVREALALRNAARQELKRQEQLDPPPLAGLGGFAALSPHGAPHGALFADPNATVEAWQAYGKRQDERTAQRRKVDAAYEAVARAATGLHLPPGADVSAILHSPDEDDAIIRLRNWLYYGRGKVRQASGRLSDPLFLYQADLWLNQEKDRLKKELGSKGSDIAVLVDRFASLRKSETSLWEDLLKIVQFVAMFIPGPVGWVLRATTAAIEAEKKMGELATKRTLYTVGGGSVDATTWEAFKVLAQMALDIAPDLPAGRLTAAERRSLGFTDDAARGRKESAERTGSSGTATATRTDPPPPRSEPDLVEPKAPPARTDDPAPATARKADDPTPQSPVPDTPRREVLLLEDGTATLRQEIAQARQRLDRLTRQAKLAEENYAKRLRPSVQFRRRHPATQQERDLLDASNTLKRLRDQAQAKVDDLEAQLAARQPRPGGPSPGAVGLTEEVRYADELAEAGVPVSLAKVNTPVIDAALVGTREVHSLKTIVASKGSEVAIQLARDGAPDKLVGLVGRRIGKSLLDRGSDKWRRFAKRWNGTMPGAYRDKFGYALPRNPDDISFVIQVRVVIGTPLPVEVQKAVEAGVERWLKKNNWKVPPSVKWQVSYVAR